MTDRIKALEDALRTKAAMIELGEKIAWGSDVALMREAADTLAASQPAPECNQPDLVTADGGQAEQPVATADGRSYRKKPVVIEAVQWTGENLREVIAFTDGPPDTKSHHAGMMWDQYEDLVRKDGLKIYTLEGKMDASPGDWIIKGVKGEFYPIKSEIFAQTYEDASGPSAPPAQPAPETVSAAYNRGYEDCLYSAGHMSAPQVQPGAPVTLTYTNWKGETAQRTIIPRRVWWGSTEWHPEPQWLLTAFDVDKGSERDFALKDFGQPAQPVAVKVSECASEGCGNPSSVHFIRGDIGSHYCMGCYLQVQKQTSPAVLTLGAVRMWCKRGEG